MRQPLPHPLLLSIAVLTALLLAPPAVGAQSVSPQTVTISGQITGGSGNHPIYVALWDASGFLTKPSQQIRIEPHASTQFRFRVSPGSWAVSAYEDENDNGKLDMGMFGPKEPSGFWRAFHGWHKPHFSEVSSAVSGDIPSADIQLRK
jgi:uncharacterized protein (DUF2141 family)